MKIPFVLIDPRFKRGPGRYFWQVLLAALTIFLVLIAEGFFAGTVITRAVLVAAIGSTAFMLFLMPHAAAAQPRHVLGGHFIGLVIGALVSALGEAIFGVHIGGEFPVVLAAQGALGVGLAMFLMVITNTEHGPAAGTALGVSTAFFSWELVLFVITSVAIMVLIHRVFRHRLTDLY
jgi:CBS-domain-containing membrane protein